MEYNVRIKIFILLMFFSISHINGQVITISEIVKDFDFGKQFKIEVTQNQKEFEYDFSKFNKATIYHTQINNKQYFLYQIDENCRFKFIFRGKYEYLAKNYGSVTDARDFLLYDKLKKKILLLKSNERGVLTNKNNIITVFNPISCLGRRVISLNERLEEENNIESVNEFDCMSMLFDEDVTSEKIQLQNNEKKVYKKLLKTKDGNTIQIEDLENRLFMMNLDTIYELLQ